MAVYNVEESEGDKRENRFAFRAKGKIYSVAKLGYLKGTTTEQLEQSVAEGHSEVKATRLMIVAECPDVADALRELRDDQVLKISQNWAKASQVTTGESSASENS